ncbi:MAG: hypothetical protein HYU78_00950 [Rhodocyclales bacterium]|nr:hypothetical protein [Rhodocyclales bacterium]
MKLLDACLSLTLTLALFASSATVLVELLQRAFKMRVKQLRAMLGVTFDRHLAAPLAAAGADVAALRASFVETVGQSRGARHMQAATRQPGRAPTAEDLAQIKPEAATSVTVDDVLRRLAHDTRFRDVFAGIETTTLRPMLEALGDGFARLEAEASALFAARARLLSYSCGIFLAFAVNVDAVRLLDHYTSNPTETAKTVAALSATCPASTGTDDNAKRQIATTIDELRQLPALGVPVGLAYYPYCSPPAGQAQFDPLCKAAPDGWLYARHFSFWLACVLVTGFLIGLGGPYWFDIAASLMQWRYLLLGQAGRREAVAATPAVATSAPTKEQWIDEIVRRGSRTTGERA